jgi:Domain of unknown function DUF11
MTTRAIFGLLLQMLCGAAAAAEANLALVSLTAPRTVVTGERITITARVRNDGPGDAANATVVISMNGVAQALSASAPADWRCAAGNPTLCRAAALPRFTEAAIEVTMLAPAEARPVSVFAIASSSTPDPNAPNNQHSVPLSLSAASANAELSLIHVSPVEEVVRPGSPARVELAVKNDGPDAARNVHLSIGFNGEIGGTAEGNGWTCSTVSVSQIRCVRTSLAPGEIAPFTAHFTAPDAEVATPLYVQTHAEENRESNTRDNFAIATIFSGAADAWQRMLLPLTATNIPGANGAMWKSSLGILIRSDEPIEIRPGACELVPVTCFPPPIPLRRPFEAHDASLIVDPAVTGQFLYVRAADASKIHFSTRAYDAARAGETSGAEIPVVHEHEFRTSTISLLNLPVSPDYRHTLRVYDADARASASVIVRLFASDATTPLAERVFTLAAPTPARRTTTALLPVHPGYLQLDLGEAFGLSGARAVRVDVVPVTPGLRLWAFVSITSNRTHHVTTVTPQ